MAYLFASLLLCLAANASAAEPATTPACDVHAEAEAAAPHDQGEVPIDDAPSRPRPRLSEEARADALAKLKTQSATDLFAFAAFGEARVQETIGDATNFNGSTARMAMIRLDVPPEVAVVGYRDGLASGGNRAWGGRLPNGAYYVAFRGQDDGLLRTLTILEQEGGSLVLAAVSDLDDQSAQVTRQPGLPPEFSTLPMRGEPTDFEIEDGPSVQHSRSVRVQAANAATAVEFHVTELTKHGWTVDDQSVTRSAENASVSLSRGDDRCSVEASRDATMPPDEVNLNVMCVTRRLP